MSKYNIKETIEQLSSILFLKNEEMNAICEKYNLLPKRNRKINNFSFLLISIIAGLNGRLNNGSKRKIYYDYYGINCQENTFSDRLSNFPTGALRDIINLIEVKISSIPSLKKKKKALALIERLHIIDGTHFNINKSANEIFGKSAGRGENCSIKLFLGFQIWGEDGVETILGSGSDHDSNFNGNYKEGSVVLRDRAWYSWNEFASFVTKGIFFISRIKSNFNPVITDIINCSTDWVGQSFNVVKNNDFNDTIKLKVRPKTGLYKDNQDCEFELWGTNFEGKRYWYLINLPSTEGLEFADIHSLYRFRWEIEEIFREIKQVIGQSGIGNLRNENSIVNQIYIMVICWLILRNYICILAKTHKLRTDGFRLDVLSKKGLLVDLICLMLNGIGLFKKEKEKLKDFEKDVLFFYSEKRAKSDRRYLRSKKALSP